MEFEEIHFWSISNLIFTACIACKFQVQNRPKMDLVENHLLIDLTLNVLDISEVCKISKQEKVKDQP